MGLCKCERRKVTNLFCFEHKVNVCDNCAVSEHSRCIIKSYLHWLQDSDYSPNCELCKESLLDESSGECVRLLCYDVFHWHCLHKWASDLPANTAPAGFQCPLCSNGIFPYPNDGSPVAVALRKLLSSANWARAGLGLPILTPEENAIAFQTNENMPQESSPSRLREHANSKTTPLQSKSVKITSSPSPVTTIPPSDSFAKSNEYAQSQDFQMQMPPADSMSLIHTTHNQSGIPVRTTHFHDEGLRNTVSSTVTSGEDLHEEAFHNRRPFINESEDVDKYKRKSPLLLLSRWLSFGASKALTPRELTLKRRRRNYMILLLFGVVIFTLIYFGASVGRYVADTDPLLDPRANPHIRVKESPSNSFEHHQQRT